MSCEMRGWAEAVDDGAVLHQVRPQVLLDAQALIQQQKTLSTFTSHADVGSFVHRVQITREDGVPQLRVQYSQFANNATERRIQALTLFHIFVMGLDVFTESLALEHWVVRAEWPFWLVRPGTERERETAALRGDAAVRDCRRVRREDVTAGLGEPACRTGRARGAG